MGGGRPAAGRVSRCQKATRLQRQRRRPQQLAQLPPPRRQQAAVPGARHVIKVTDTLAAMLVSGAAVPASVILLQPLQHSTSAAGCFRCDDVLSPADD